MASNQPMRSYQTTFLFNCRILLLLYVVELYNHINRAIRPSYGSRKGSDLDILSPVAAFALFC